MFNNIGVGSPETKLIEAENSDTDAM